MKIKYKITCTQKISLHAKHSEYRHLILTAGKKNKIYQSH